MKRGDKVICIDGTPPKFGPGRVVKGQVYVIRGFDEAGSFLLEGVADDVTALFGTIGWRPDRFRNTDISSLEALLDTECSTHPSGIRAALE